MNLSRRRMFQTMALAPAAGLLGQELSIGGPTLEGATAGEFARRGVELYNAAAWGSAPVLSPVAQRMVDLLTVEQKRDMEALLRSDWIVTQDPNTAFIPYMFRCNDLVLDPYSDLADLFIGGSSVRFRPQALAFLDQVGIQGFVDELPRQLTRPGCGPNPYLDGYLAGVGLISTGLGVATMLGCVPCGHIAVGMGVGVAILKAVQTFKCLGV